ncbi:MAG TPA: glycosyltransferase family 1 protein [Xanthobacteraceae bacterium]|nr:glycosyltransferase family 1 protein [Xanthobacteraceae bacterium]
MKILIATDAWYPQVNGVVRTLTMTAEAARRMGSEIVFLTPNEFRTFGLPTYREVRVALPGARRVAELIEAHEPDAIHIATEGPLGAAVRRYCLRRRIGFTTSFHTRFPEYVSARLPVSEEWVWAWLRRFHRPSRAVMAATPSLQRELRERGFSRVAIWPRGVDAKLFQPWDIDLGLPRPIFMSVGRVAVEKNLEAFLSLDLPGTKVVVGDGPARRTLERQFPKTVFLGAKQGEALANAYAAADVFVFPSRTDTFGLVLLEALASGVPVAAFPVAGPRDVIGSAPVGVLDEDLRKACLAALELSRSDCRAFALRHSWDEAARAFIQNIVASGATEPVGALGRLAAAARAIS